MAGIALRQERVESPLPEMASLLSGCDLLGVGEAGVDVARPDELADFIGINYHLGWQPHDGDFRIEVELQVTELSQGFRLHLGVD